MKNFIVLGSGCKKCVQTAQLIEQLAQEQGVAVNVVKETNPEIIMGYGVMSTPAVVVDDKVVHSGSIPTAPVITQWLNGSE